MFTCTLVTAYYTIPSKFPSATYLAWANNFLQLENPIVLFTSSELESTLRQMRGDRPLHVITRPFQELDAWTKYETRWKENHKLDRENGHSPELYAIWAQKSFFVQEAIRVNAFDTPYFVWSDIGIFRDKLLPHIQKTYPQSRYLSSDRVLFSSIEPLRKEDLVVQDGIPGRFDHKTVRLVGGIWGGSIFALRRWHERYQSMLETYFKVGRFAGKDQLVMLSTLLQDPTLAMVVRSTLPQYDSWFFLTHLLSASPVKYELDSSYLNFRHPPMTTITLQGGLGNQIFQIITAYANARRHSGIFRICQTKPIPDNRPLYWDSFFRLMAPHAIPVLPPLPDHKEIKDTTYQVLPSSCHLVGFFQTPKYFQEYRDEILLFLTPSPAIRMKLKEKYAFLLERKEDVVVVHARRTDYCLPRNIAFHGPLQVDYYRQAVDKMMKHVKNPLFLLCSDDVNYWKETNLFQDKKHFLMENEDEITTLALLSQFHYYILANSTFSWWGAWLASTRHVIAPSRWFGPAGPPSYQDIYMPEWEKI